MEDKTKILYLISGSEIGGAEKMLLLLAEKISLRNFSPVIVSVKGKGRFTEAVENKKLKIYTINLKKNPFSFFQLIKILKKEKPEILHTFLYAGNIAGRIASVFTNIPVVVSSQRSTDDWRKWYHWKIDYVTSKLCDVIVSNSHKGKKVLMEKSRIPGEKISVIPNGIEIKENVIPVSKKDLHIKKGQWVIGTVGNLRKPKGHIFLIEAASYILKEFHQTKFIIVGDGNLKEFLIKETMKRKIRANFIFPGFQPHPERIMSILDVFILPSLWEGCPVSLLEAMSLRKPCVATEVGDVPFLIQNGENGIIVPPGNSRILAQSVVKLLKNESLRKRLGEKAVQTVRDKFLCEKMLNDYDSLYKKL